MKSNDYGYLSEEHEFVQEQEQEQEQLLISSSDPLFTHTEYNNQYLVDVLSKDVDYINKVIYEIRKNKFMFELGHEEKKLSHIESFILAVAGKEREVLTEQEMLAIKIYGEGNWAGNDGDFSPYLLSTHPLWKDAGLKLKITTISEQGTSDQTYGEGDNFIHVQLRDNHYQAIINGTPVNVAGNGDCFYLAVNEVLKQPEFKDAANIVFKKNFPVNDKDAVRYLRTMLANHVLLDENVNQIINGFFIEGENSREAHITSPVFSTAFQNIANPFFNSLQEKIWDYLEKYTDTINEIKSLEATIYDENNSIESKLYAISLALSNTRVNNQLPNGGLLYKVTRDILHLIRLKNTLMTTSLSLQGVESLLSEMILFCDEGGALCTIFDWESINQFREETKYLQYWVSFFSRVNTLSKDSVEEFLSELFQDEIMPLWVIQLMDEVKILYSKLESYSSEHQNNKQVLIWQGWLNDYIGEFNVSQKIIPKLSIFIRMVMDEALMKELLPWIKYVHPDLGALLGAVGIIRKKWNELDFSNTTKTAYFNEILTFANATRKEFIGELQGSSLAPLMEDITNNSIGYISSDEKAMAMLNLCIHFSASPFSGKKFLLGIMRDSAIQKASANTVWQARFNFFDWIGIPNDIKEAMLALPKTKLWRHYHATEWKDTPYLVWTTLREDFLSIEPKLLPVIISSLGLSGPLNITKLVELLDKLMSKSGDYTHKMAHTIKYLKAQPQTIMDSIVLWVLEKTLQFYLLWKIYNTIDMDEGDKLQREFSGLLEILPAHFSTLLINISHWLPLLREVRAALGELPSIKQGENYFDWGAGILKQLKTSTAEGAKELYIRLSHLLSNKIEENTRGLTNNTISTINTFSIDTARHQPEKEDSNMWQWVIERPAKNIKNLLKNQVVSMGVIMLAFSALIPGAQGESLSEGASSDAAGTLPGDDLLSESAREDIFALEDKVANSEILEQVTANIQYWKKVMYLSGGISVIMLISAIGVRIKKRIDRKPNDDTTKPTDATELKLLYSDDKVSTIQIEKMDRQDDNTENAHLIESQENKQTEKKLNKSEKILSWIKNNPMEIFLWATASSAMIPAVIGGWKWSSYRQEYDGFLGQLPADNIYLEVTPELMSFLTARSDDQSADIHEVTEQEIKSLSEKYYHDLSLKTTGNDLLNRKKRAVTKYVADNVSQWVAKNWHTEGAYTASRNEFMQEILSGIYKSRLTEETYIKINELFWPLRSKAYLSSTITVYNDKKMSSITLKVSMIIQDLLWEFSGPVPVDITTVAPTTTAVSTTPQLISSTETVPVNENENHISTGLITFIEKNWSKEQSYPPHLPVTYLAEKAIYKDSTNVELLKVGDVYWKISFNNTHYDDGEIHNFMAHTTINVFKGKNKAWTTLANNTNGDYIEKLFSWNDYSKPFSSLLKKELEYLIRNKKSINLSDLLQQVYLMLNMLFIKNYKNIKVGVQIIRAIDELYQRAEIKNVILEFSVDLDESAGLDTELLNRYIKARHIDAVDEILYSEAVAVIEFDEQYNIFEKNRRALANNIASLEKRIVNKKSIISKLEDMIAIAKKNKDLKYFPNIIGDGYLLASMDLNELENDLSDRLQYVSEQEKILPKLKETLDNYIRETKDKIDLIEMYKEGIAITTELIKKYSPELLEEVNSKLIPENLNKIRFELFEKEMKGITSKKIVNDQDDYSSNVFYAAKNYYNQIVHWQFMLTDYIVPIFEKNKRIIDNEKVKYTGYRSVIATQNIVGKIFDVEKNGQTEIGTYLSSSEKNETELCNLMVAALYHYYTSDLNVNTHSMIVTLKIYNDFLKKQQGLWKSNKSELVDYYSIDDFEPRRFFDSQLEFNEQFNKYKSTYIWPDQYEMTSGLLFGLNNELTLDELVNPVKNTFYYHGADYVDNKIKPLSGMFKIIQLYNGNWILCSSLENKFKIKKFSSADADSNDFIKLLIDPDGKMGTLELTTAVQHADQYPYKFKNGDAVSESFFLHGIMDVENLFKEVYGEEPINVKIIISRQDIKNTPEKDSLNDDLFTRIRRVVKFSLLDITERKKNALDEAGFWHHVAKTIVPFYDVIYKASTDSGYSVIDDIFSIVMDTLSVVTTVAALGAKLTNQLVVKITASVITAKQQGLVGHALIYAVAKTVPGVMLYAVKDLFSSGFLVKNIWDLIEPLPVRPLLKKVHKVFPERPFIINQSDSIVSIQKRPMGQCHPSGSSTHSSTDSINRPIRLIGTYENSVPLNRLTEFVTPYPAEPLPTSVSLEVIEYQIKNQIGKKYSMAQGITTGSSDTFIRNLQLRFWNELKELVEKLEYAKGRIRELDDDLNSYIGESFGVSDNAEYIEKIRVFLSNEVDRIYSFLMKHKGTGYGNVIFASTVYEDPQHAGRYISNANSNCYAFVSAGDIEQRVVIIGDAFSDDKMEGASLSILMQQTVVHEVSHHTSGSTDHYYIDLNPRREYPTPTVALEEFDHLIEVNGSRLRASLVDFIAMIYKSQNIKAPERFLKKHNNNFFSNTKKNALPIAVQQEIVRMLRRDPLLKINARLVDADELSLHLLQIGQLPYTSAGDPVAGPSNTSGRGQVAGPSNTSGGDPVAGPSRERPRRETNDGDLFLRKILLTQLLLLR